MSPPTPPHLLLAKVLLLRRYMSTNPHLTYSFVNKLQKWKFFVCNFPGVGNIPWALVGEMFPSNVKPTAATFVAIVNGLLAFATSNLFPELLHYLGIDILFLTCSLLSLLGGVFTLAAVTDTSKMSFQEIQDMLGGKSRQVGEKSEQSQLVRSVAWG